MRPIAALALALLAGCRAYMPSSAPLAPGTETVRLALARPRDVVLAGAEGAGGARSDTIRGATAVYGRVVRLERDTVWMAVTQVARGGMLQYMPDGRAATIEMSTVSGVERWSHSPRRTTVLVSIIAGAALAVGLFFWALGEAMAES